MGSDTSRPGESNREVRKARYIKGICIDCGEAPHSAGRPRCDKCHGIYRRWIPGA